MDGLAGIHPLADAIPDSLADDAELSVTQVQPQFLEGTADLDPWMVPGQDAIYPLAECHMFNHVAGMVEGELHGVASHGENAAVGTGQGGRGAGKVGAVCGDTQVVDEVVPRHDGKP